MSIWKGMEKDVFQSKTFLYSFLAAILSCLVVYGFELSNFTLSIDEDTTDNFLHTIDLGRWGHAFLKNYLFPEPWVPFSSLLFALICVSASAAICSASMKLSKSASVIFAILFISIPQLAYQFEFSNQDETFGIAILLSSASSLFLNEINKIKFIIFVLLNFLALSIYQSLILFSATLMTLCYLKQYINGSLGFKSWVIKSSVISAGLALSLGFYLVATKFIKQHFGVTSPSYFTSIIMWGQLGLHGGILNALSFIYDRSGPYPLYGLGIYKLTYLFSAMLLIFILRKNPSKLPLSILLVSLCLLLPFAINIAIAAGTPGRTLTQIPLVFAGITIIFFEEIRCHALKYLYCFCILLIGCNASSQLFYSDHVASNMDKGISSRLLSDIYSKYPDFNEQKNRVGFYGSLQTQNPWKKFNSDDFGVTFFERGSGQRVVNMININGDSSIKAVPEDELHKKHIGTINKMSAWPEAGGIEKVGDDIIVKLSK